MSDDEDQIEQPLPALDLHRSSDQIALIFGEPRARKITRFVALHDLNPSGQFAPTMIQVRQGAIQAQGAPEVPATSPAADCSG